MMFFATPVSLPRRKSQRLHGVSALSFCVPLALLLACGAALAQAPNCDEGVIRLPDRSGTVVICSALAAQMPQLARQLTDATRMLGSQQGQMAELTRLVRGLNGVSQGIGIERQAQMLQNLSLELTASQRGGDARTQRAVESLSEKLEELQAKMLSALTRQATSAGTAAALNGPVGDAIARLELGSAGRQLDEINARLQALQTQVGEVRNDTAAIRQDMQGLQASLKGVAREVSDDPRKELVKRGYSVDRRGLEKAMLQKDLVALAHFNASGYVPRYREFVGFLFHEGWDPLVFNALSPQMLGLPGSCSEWAIYHSMGFEIDKLKLQHEVRLCGRETFIGKLLNFLEVKTSDSQSYPYDWAEEKEKLEQLRKTINPKKKQPVIAAGSTMYLDECTFNRFCEQGITPQDFAVREKSYLDGVAAWEASKKQWRAEVERTIELVKKM